MKYSFLFIFLLLAGCSCSEEEIIEPKFSKRDIMFAVIKADPNAREVLPKDMNSGIKCSDYGPGCVRGYVGRVVDFEMILVEFENTALARQEAMRINQFYARNWVLDDVRDEPPLEKFVKKVLGAINPLEKKDEGEKETSAEKAQSSPSK